MGMLDCRRFKFTFWVSGMGVPLWVYADVQLHASPSLIPSLPCHSERSEESPLFAERKGVRGMLNERSFDACSPLRAPNSSAGWIGSRFCAARQYEPEHRDRHHP